jgi:GxxExxY protein
MAIMELPHLSPITSRIIKAAIEVHTTLGPGLLESVYVKRLELEMRELGLHVDRNVPVPIIYKGVSLDCRLIIDLLVNDVVVVEVKSVEGIAPVHEAQLLTYLRLTGREVGLLMNFNVVRMVNGIRRKLNSM